MRRVYYILPVTLMLISMSVRSQDTEPTIQMVGSVTKSSIKLRWAPTSPGFWKLANEYGYTLERITLMQNGEVIPNPPKKIISEYPFKPELLINWEPYSDDDFVAVAAQAIYGESFEVTDDASSGMMRIIHKAQELENRFSFALWAADMSIRAATLHGLAYVDEEVAVGYKYLYRVYANTPLDLPSDTAIVFLGLEDYEPLPQIPDVRVEFTDRIAHISWDAQTYRNFYNAFWIQRSVSGSTFQNITESPFTNTYQKEVAPSRFTISDSLETNQLEYSYRVVGVTSFGDLGSPSDTVTGKGLPAFNWAPSITGFEIQKEGVSIEWNFSSEGTDLLDHFSLRRQIQISKTLEPVVKDIAGEERMVLDRFPHTTNYYIIQAHDRFGRTTSSFPFLVQLEDSIPPASPLGFEGYIDTLGRVHLRWIPNKEPDLEGYKLYRSNFPNGGYVQVPGPIILQDTFVDTISLKNLSEEIFYKVQALDHRFNSSALSPPLGLKKPDLIPPVAPVFLSIGDDSLGIRLTWSKSASEDVLQYVLYRRSEQEVDWTFIELFDKEDIPTYYDQGVRDGQRYAYTLIAVDDDRLESMPAVPVSLKRSSSTLNRPVSELYHILNQEGGTIKVSWTYPEGDVDKFLVYKSQEGMDLSLYKEVAGSEREFTDTYDISGSRTAYRVMVAFKSGKKSDFSKPIVIEH